MDLTHVQALISLPAATVTGPTVCSSDGLTILEIYATSAQPEVAIFPEVYAVDDEMKVTRIVMGVPSEYKISSLRSLYASRIEAVGLIQATLPTNKDSSLPKGERVAFLSVTNLNTGTQKLIPLDLPLEPVKAAILSSSEFVVLGVEKANQLPVLLLLNEDGSFERNLSLDVNTYLQSSELQAIYKQSKDAVNGPSLHRAVLASLEQAQFIASGDDLLLVQPGSRSPVYRLRSNGQQDAVTLQLPPSLLVQAILGSDDRDSWVVLAGDNSSLKKVAGGGVSENPVQELYEVSPLTGEVLDQLTVRGPQTTEISCAAHGKLSAIYYGIPPKEGTDDQLGYAFARR